MSIGAEKYAASKILARAMIHILDSDWPQDVKWESMDIVNFALMSLAFERPAYE